MARCAILLVSLVGLAAAGLAVLRPKWATAVGLDVWNVLALERTISAEERRREMLMAQLEIIRDRAEAKRQVVLEVLARRLTLLQAAAHFRRLNAEPPDLPGSAPEILPGRTENERYCRLILDRVRDASKDMAPSQAVELLHQLEDELETHLAQHGGEVVLPDL
jgi:hypothetical protein